MRTDRPRLLLSNGSGFGTSVATFRQRCTSDPATMSRCQSALGSAAGSYPALNSAALYVVRGDATGCTDAYTRLQAIAADAPGQPDPHSFISNNGRTMAQLAVTRDWCEGALSDAQRTWIEDRMVAYADWYLANPAPDVFHDDMPNLWNAVALAGLALKGTAQDAKAQTYLAAADQQWKTVILPAFAYVGDWWHEGFVYVQPSLGSLAWYALAWSTATDENIFAYARQQAGDLFEGYLRFHAYAMRPDYRYFYFGDTTDNKQSIELFSRPLVDMLTLGTGSPLGQALSLEIKAHARPGYDYSGADGFLLALLYDASRDGAATPRSQLPLGAWMSRGANDVVILRSGWGADDTVVMISCGDYLGPHQHDESGSFQIFHHGPLTGSTGYYDSFDSPHWANYYSQHSVHANTLAIYQPGEIFPTSLSIGNPSANVNDGGQRPLRRDRNGTGYPSPDLPTYRMHKTSGPFYETGDVKTFAQTSCHAYVACDVTAAYNAPGFSTNGNAPKVTEVTRQFVFLPPTHVLVFDRVEATDASYDKRFLLHAIGTVTVGGSGAFTLASGSGTLHGRTVLPVAADVVTVPGFEVAGTPYPPGVTGQESGGTRLEISPHQEAMRDYFLHVLDTADGAGPPAPTLQDGATGATVGFSDGAHDYTVTLAKTGSMGGHVKVVAGGTVLCDQDLGAGAENPDGGVGGTGGSGGAGGAGGSSAQPDASGGCGCRVAAAGPEDAGMGRLMGALALVGALGGRAFARLRRRPHTRAGL
ncbi:MAG TPA: hypothetical protein VKN99_12690 [Polyangia bacterium]|nr:hypothetical protein [Polyangia bacterium]